MLAVIEVGGNERKNLNPKRWHGIPLGFEDHTGKSGYLEPRIEGGQRDLELRDILRLHCVLFISLT